MNGIIVESLGRPDDDDPPRPVVIAMKGHPGTGKSTLATAIAKALRCPLVDKDHFRDSTYAIQQALAVQNGNDSSSAAKKLLNDLSYEVMWRVVSTQLSLGLSVVVDSPLSTRARLDRLKELAAECGGGARVVIVECRAGDEAEWRERIERRGAAVTDGGPGWHKPSTWRDMEEILEGYGGCWDYDVGEDVPKLVLDTTARGVELAQLVFEVIEFLSS